jgi:hypothetical protein
VRETRKLGTATAIVARFDKVKNILPVFLFCILGLVKIKLDKV